MANFDALFAGCESFMEGDVEINNDVTVPAGDDAEAVAAETTAEDLGAEGAETVADSDNEVAEGEAANMVFDQVLAMYDHVKDYGIDRTFLSLYNRNGQLDQMINYRFPSCESIDSVGSPRSQASQAFIVAMEEDGIFSKIWAWIKKVCNAIANFFIKIMDWFREAMGNQELRIGKLGKMVERSEVKSADELKDIEIMNTTKSDLRDFVKNWKIIQDIVTGQIDSKEITTGVSGTNFSTSEFTAKGPDGFYSGRDITASGNLLEAENACVELNDQACKGAENAAAYRKTGKYKDYTIKVDKKKGIDKVDQAKYFVKKCKKVLDDIKKNISKLGSEREKWTKVAAIGVINSIGPKDKYTEANIKTVLPASVRSLSAHLTQIIKVRQFLDRMKLNQKHMQQNAETGYRLATGGSMDREASEDGRKSTQCFNLIVNLRMQALNLCNAQLNKEIAIVADHAKSLLKGTGGERAGRLESREELQNRVDKP